MESRIDTGSNGWNEYRREVLKILSDHSERLASIEAKVVELKVSLAVLETKHNLKSGVWGMLGGAIPALVALMWMILQP